MGNIKYVIASLPRSGTKYISKVLCSLGLNCGHEKYFNTNTCRYSEDTKNYVFGDASWMSVPYISSLPPGTIVFHQLRDPLKVLNSNLPPGGDSYFRTWDEHAGLHSDTLYKKNIPWKRFIWESTSEWVWPGGVGETPESPQEIRRLIHWWENWNLWIEFAASRRSDLTYIRYRLEDLDSELLEQIVRVIKGEEGDTIKECKEVLASTSKTTNRHRQPNTRITIDMLPASARLLMYKYGY